MRRRWLVGVLALVATSGCIPDVNVTGIRGEGGATGNGGAGASIPYQVGYTTNNPAEVTHPGGSHCIEVQCPPGFYVTQGGGYWPPRIVGIDQVSLEFNAPIDFDRWQLCGVTADNFTHKWLVETFCANFITQAAEESAVHGGGRDCPTAECPPGMEVVGGGADFAGGFDKIRLDSSRPTAENAWTICGYADQGGVHGWTAKAVCAEIDVSIHTDTDTHLGDGDCLQHTCPAGLVAVGGGGEWEMSNASDGGWASGLRPTATMAGPVGMTICSERASADTENWAVDVLCTADAVPILPD